MFKALQVEGTVIFVFAYIYLKIFCKKYGRLGGCFRKRMPVKPILNRFRGHFHTGFCAVSDSPVAFMQSSGGCLRAVDFHDADRAAGRRCRRSPVIDKRQRGGRCSGIY